MSLKLSFNRAVFIQDIPDADAVDNCLSSFWGLGHKLLLHAGIGQRIYTHTQGKGLFLSLFVL